MNFSCHTNVEIYISYYCAIRHEWTRMSSLRVYDIRNRIHRRRWEIRSPFIGASPISDKVGHGRHGPGRDTPTGRYGGLWPMTTTTTVSSLIWSRSVPRTPVSSSERTRRLSSAAGSRLRLLDSSSSRCWRWNRSALDSARMSRARMTANSERKFTRAL